MNLASYSMVDLMNQAGIELKNLLGDEYKLFVGYVPDRPSKPDDSTLPFIAVMMSSGNLHPTGTNDFSLEVYVGQTGTVNDYAQTVSRLYDSLESIYRHIVDEHNFLAGAHVESCSLSIPTEQPRPVWIGCLTMTVEIPAYISITPFLT